MSGPLTNLEADAIRAVAAGEMPDPYVARVLRELLLAGLGLTAAACDPTPCAYRNSGDCRPAPTPAGNGGGSW